MNTEYNDLEIQKKVKEHLRSLGTQKLSKNKTEEFITQLYSLDENKSEA